MTLAEYFENAPRGAKTALALKLGISKTWMSLLVSGREVPSPELCMAIERATKGRVKRAVMRPDIFGGIL
jgi:hypothetical protein